MVTALGWEATPGGWAVASGSKNGPMDSLVGEMILTGPAWASVSGGGRAC